MLSERLANIIFSILVICACIFFAVIAERFETSGLLASSGLPSKFFPHLMLALMAFCSVVVLFVYARHGSAGEGDDQTVFGDAGDARRGILMLAVAVACYLIWMNIGFITMAVIMGPLSLLVMGVRSPKIYLVVMLLTVLVYLAFTQLLGTQL